MKKEENIELLSRMLQLLRNDFSNVTFICTEYKAKLDLAYKRIEELEEKIADIEQKEAINPRKKAN